MIRTLALLALLGACGDDGTATPDAPVAIDAAIDSNGGLATTCTGPCASTSLTATFGATTRVLDLAFYGVTTEAGTQTLHVEAYRGAAMACPTMTSPTPDYTLILGRVPPPTSSTPSTSPGNILDYEGDLLGGPLGAAATQVTLAPVAANAFTEAAGFVAFDVQLTFAAGTITGHLHAAHCASLDETI